MSDWNSKGLSYAKYAIISLVILSFAFFGIYQTITSRQPYVAKIGSTKITMEEYNSHVSKRRTEILSGAMSNKEIYNQALAFVESSQFSKIALNEIINKIIIHKFLVENNIHVTIKTVASYIKTMPMFQQDGKFQVEYFKQYLHYANISEYDFLKSQIPQVEQLLFDQTLSSARIQSKEFAKKYAIALKKERNIDVLYIKPEANLQFSEDELKAIYNNNKAKFVQKPQHFVMISYIDDYINSNLNIFNADSQSISDYYNEEFTGKVIDFFYAEFKDEKTAETAQSIVKKQGISLQSVVETMKKTNKLSIANSGSTSSDKMEKKAILHAILNLSVNNVTDVIHDGKSYFVIQISQIREAKFTQTKDSQAQDVAKQRKCHNANIYIEKIKQELESGSSFEGVSLKYGFPISKQVRVDTSTGNVFDANTNLSASIEGALKDSIVKNEDTQYGHVLILDKEKCSYAIYQQHRIEPERIKTLDEVRGQIIDMSIKAKKQQWLEKTAQGIIGQMQSLHTKLGSYSTQGEFANQTVKITTAFSPEVFSHKVGESFFVINKNPEGEDIATIVSINSDTPFRGNASREEVSEADAFVTQAYYNSFAKEFMLGLYKQYKVTVQN